MKRVLKILLKTAIVLLLLPLFVVFGLFIYAQYINPDAEDTMKEMTEIMEKSARPGNGFGGEEGFFVLDSGQHASRKFFWIDNNNLVFSTDRNAHSAENVQRNFVWNTQTNIQKPLLPNISISCFSKEYFYYANPSEVEELPNGKRRAQLYQSHLKELDDKWVIESAKEIESIWVAPSDEYELYWSDQCQPWFHLNSDQADGYYLKKYRFSYLSEWDWIIRTPQIGSEDSDPADSNIGFFELNEKAYFGQKGNRVATLVELPVEDIPSLRTVYIDFLHRYWLATQVYGNRKRKIFLGFLDRNGEFEKVEWPDSWLDYAQIPLPTKKGLFWGGYDYRVSDPSSEDKGGFLRDRNGNLRKVMQGSVINPQLSGDGCSVAMFNTPRNDLRPNASLKVFNACVSVVNRKELKDADY